MKKYSLVIVILILAMVWATPVQAASGKVTKEKVSVSAPSNAIAGTTFNTTITISGEGRSEISFAFPKDVVAKVVSQNNLTVVQNQQAFVFKLDKVLKPKNNYSYTFSVTLKSGVNNPSALWLKLTSRKGLSLVRTIQVSMPVIVTPKAFWTVAIPNSAVGNKPYAIAVTVVNNSSVSVPFDLSVKLLFSGGCDRSAYPQFTGGEFYNAIGNSTGYEMFWRGTIPANSSYTLNIQTRSGTTTGSFDILEVKNLLYPNDPRTLGKITIVP